MENNNLQNVFPSFSVLMSVYSKENPVFFDLALESILINQSLVTNDFVLICDGPLSDELDSVILRYQIRFPILFHVYRLPENVGLGRALNFGLTKCTFDYVARADSDDICVYERFEKQLRFLSQHPSIAVLGSDIQEFDFNPNEPISYKKMPSSSKAVFARAKSRNPVNHMTVIFKKSVVESVGSYMHLSFLEDYFLWVRILASGYEIENLNEPLVYARVGNGMFHRRSNKAYISSWQILNKYMKGKKIISKAQYLRNMVYISVFIFMPVSFKKWIYQKALREKGK